MYELQMDEIDQVNGGGLGTVVVIVVIVAAVGMGIYNGYQDEAAADKGKAKK